MLKPGVNGKNGKPILVILEGSDRSGKSTIYQALRRATNYQAFVIDRFVGSNFAYDRVFDRENREPEYLQLEEKLSDIFDILVVFLHADDEILFSRESTDEERRDIISVKEPYRIYKEQTSLPVLSFNTGEETVEEIVEDLAERIRNREAGI